MIRRIVNSSMLASVGYDPVSLILEVEFNTSHQIYRFLGVSQDVYAGLMTADSIGKFFNAHIRTVYTSEKLGIALVDWIAGHNVREEGGGIVWEVLGVFSTEEGSVQACGSVRCFVGPMTRDVAFPMDPMKWEGCYYPHLTPKEGIPLPVIVDRDWSTQETATMGMTGGAPVETEVNFDAG
jgi:KTSC domain